MIELNQRGVKLQFTPRDPEVWDSVDTWTAVKKFPCGYASLTSEMQVRAGRDSAEKGLRVYYTDVKLAAGDRIRLGGSQWLVVYADDMSANGLNYCDVKAAP